MNKRFAKLNPSHHHMPTIPMAFIFALNGVLMTSNELQIEAIQKSYCAILQRYNIQDQAPIRSILVQKLLDCDEQEGMLSAAHLVPSCTEHAQEIYELSKTIYSRLLIDQSSKLGIKDSAVLLRSLWELGYNVGIISRWPSLLSKYMFETLQIEFGLPESIPVISCDEHEKIHTTADLLLQALDRFKISSKHCVVVDISPHGIRHARTRGIYTIGLVSKYCSGKYLLDNGAHEATASLLNTRKVSALMYGASAPTPSYRSLTFHELTVQKMSKTQIDKLVHETYSVYSSTMQGRSIESWRKKLCDLKDSITRVAVLANTKGSLIAYGVLKIRHICYDNEKRLLYLGSVASLPEMKKNNGGAILLAFFQREIRRGNLTFPQCQAHMVDNFLGVSGYTVGLRIFRVMAPSIDQRIPTVEEEKYMRFLADRIGYEKAPVTDPYLYKSPSRLRPDASRSRELNMSDAQRFFHSRVDVLKGYGLYTIAVASFDNLQPYIGVNLEQARL